MSERDEKDIIEEIEDPNTEGDIEDDTEGDGLYTEDDGLNTAGGALADEESLPLYVKLNNRHGAMWFDDLSGLKVSQFGGQDIDGNDIKDYARVPTKADCSRIREALRRGILVPCDPTGKSKLIKDRPLVKADSTEALMKRNTSELIAIINQVSDAELLSTMKKWEETRNDGRNRRIAVLDAIAKRMKSRDVLGVTEVESTPSYRYDSKTGRMIEDTIRAVPMPTGLR